MESFLDLVFDSDDVNQYKFSDDSFDCVEDKLSAGGKSMFQVVTYDWWMLHQLLIAVFSMITNLGVVYMHLTRPAHPKFNLRFARKWCMHIHVSCGITEILTGFIGFFVPGAENISFIVRIQAIASMIHCTSAFHMLPIVFGVQAFMIPAYFFLTIVKLMAAINLFLNPLCYTRSLVLFNLLSVYAWVRMLYLLFLKLRIFAHARYSFSIMLAGFVCLPAIGISTNLIALLFIFLYILLIRCVYGKDSLKYLRQFKENSRNPFENALSEHGMFYDLFKDLKCGKCPFGYSRTKEEVKWDRRSRMHGSHVHSDSSRDEYISCLFKHMSKRKSNAVGMKDMQDFFLPLKERNVYLKLKKIIKEKESENPDEHYEVNFAEFREAAESVLEDGKFGVKLRIKAIDDAKAKKKKRTYDFLRAKFVFEMFDNKDNGYLDLKLLGPILMQFGLSLHESQIILELYNQGGGDDRNYVFEGNIRGSINSMPSACLSFEEFLNGLKPLWEYVFEEFRFALEEMVEIEKEERKYKYLQKETMRLFEDIGDSEKSPVKFLKVRKKFNPVRIGPNHYSREVTIRIGSREADSIVLTGTEALEEAIRIAERDSDNESVVSDETSLEHYNV